MARKQSKAPAKKKVSVEPEDETELMLVRLQLPASIHRDFRVEAAKEGRSMANMARRLIEDWVARRKLADITQRG